MSIEILFSPHPPVLVPAVGHGRELEASPTLEGMAAVARRIAELKPETIIFISPHGNMFRDALAILDEPHLLGSFSRFGASRARSEKDVDIELTNAIIEEFHVHGVPHVVLDDKQAKRYGVSAELDHGVLVPMHFIDAQYSDYAIVHITPTLLPHRDLYRAGNVMAHAVERIGRRVLILASGDLAHCFEGEGPPPPESAYAVFDHALVDAVRRADVPGVIDMDQKVYGPAQECGLKSFCIALGALDGFKVHTEVFSYESPFGVGYMCGRAFGQGAAASLLESFDKESRSKVEKMRQSEDAFIRLAREAVEHFVKTGEHLDWDSYKKTIPREFVQRVEHERAGAFVSMHREGDLRGCIGTIAPTQEDLAHEIIHCAVEACSEDPRFDPVGEYELSGLDVKVDILGQPESIPDASHLDPQKYGVIVQKGWKRGLLLPALEGVDTVEQQISIACSKAGITDVSGIELSRFIVERHEAHG